jgi:hypothetical protein
MPPTTDELLTDLATRFQRVERAILGDPSVGHRGLVSRVETLETTTTGREAEHKELEKSRIEGDRRVHERIDKVDTTADSNLRRIEKKLDRSIWMTGGAFLGGLGLGTTGWWQQFVGG